MRSRKGGGRLILASDQIGDAEEVEILVVYMRTLRPGGSEGARDALPSSRSEKVSPFGKVKGHVRLAKGPVLSSMQLYMG
jgi:hypothetical protein